MGESRVNGQICLVMEIGYWKGGMEAKLYESETGTGKEELRSRS